MVLNFIKKNRFDYIDDIYDLLVIINNNSIETITIYDDEIYFEIGNIGVSCYINCENIFGIMITKNNIINCKCEFLCMCENYEDYEMHYSKCDKSTIYIYNFLYENKQENFDDIYFIIKDDGIVKIENYVFYLNNNIEIIFFEKCAINSF
uniref:Uncharacterized protein n=1 Tax=Pithovirus LCDPAC02 TaxID=2506601 RepID=A0A481YQ00_9VIRU|nr:MAG: hypothetical protein LCDPAC02_01960 [Pithovirus LCDPAC02]